MKKRLSLVLLLSALTLLVSSCYVNENMGAITIQNRTNITVNNIKVGKVSFGLLGFGQTRTIYFSGEENDAVIDITGFSPPKGYNGTIDLKKNYHYNCELIVDSEGVYRIDRFSGYRQSSNVFHSEYQISIK